MWQARRVLCVQADIEQDVRGGQGYGDACAYQTLKAREESVLGLVTQLRYLYCPGL